MFSTVHSNYLQFFGVNVRDGRGQFDPSKRLLVTWFDDSVDFHTQLGVKQTTVRRYLHWTHRYEHCEWLPWRQPPRQAQWMNTRFRSRKLAQQNTLQTNRMMWLTPQWRWNDPAREKLLTVHNLNYSRTENRGVRRWRRAGQKEALSAVGLARGQSVHAIHSRQMLIVSKYKLCEHCPGPSCWSPNLVKMCWFSAACVLKT